MWVTLRIVSATFLLSSLHCANAQSPRAPEGYWLGEARGEYPTGTIEELWIDESRDELTTSTSDDKRHMMIQIWYPATYSGDANKAPYVISPELHGQLSLEWLERVPNDLTNSVLNADMSPGSGRYPVIIYSHGAGFPHFSATFQTEYLASHGYVVVSVSHAMNDSLVRYPDGYEYFPDVLLPQPDENRSFLEQSRWRWANPAWQRMLATQVEDISYAIDRLEQLDSEPGNRFYQRLDLDRIGAFGWSMGGATSFQSTVDDPRVKAAINQDGVLFGRPVERTGAQSPVMFIGGLPNNERAIHGDVNPNFQELNAEVGRRLWHMFAITGSDWYSVALIGAEHIHFSDVALIEQPLGQLSVQRAHSITNALVREFFDRYLKSNMDTPLLSRTESHPELRIATPSSE